MRDAQPLRQITGNGNRLPRRGLALLALLLCLANGCGVRGARPGDTAPFSQGVRPAAEDAERLVSNARYFMLMGRPEMALPGLEQEHRRNPGNLKVASALAQYYDALGLHRQAQEVYQEILELDPDNPAISNNRCFSYYLAGDFPQAERCFQKTLARQPQNRAARNNLGLVLCRQGRPEEARRLWSASDGEAAAAAKVAEVLALLEMAGDARYAQGPARQPEAPAVPLQAAAPPPAARSLTRPAPVPSAQPSAHDRQALGNPPMGRAAPLTAQDLVATRIAILNGNGQVDSARRTRASLHRQGYNVVTIGNYRDFGMHRTVIQFRPQAEQVAATLNRQFFPEAEIAPAPHLAKHIDVQVILGRDLLPPHQARTTGREPAPTR